MTHCPKCKTELAFWQAIGHFCPNKECDVVDGILLYDEHGKLKDDEWKKSPSKKKKTLRLEYRIRPDKAKFWHRGILADWKNYRRYRTEAEREKAMNVLNKKDTLFEYRIPEPKAK